MGALSAAGCVDQRSGVPQNSVRADIAGSLGSQDRPAFFAESNPATTSRSSLQETEVKQKLPIIPTNRLSQNPSPGDRGGCHRRPEDLRGKAHPEPTPDFSAVADGSRTLYRRPGEGMSSFHKRSGSRLYQDAEKLLDRGSPCTGMHGTPEPGRSVRQGHAKAWSHHEAGRGQGLGIRKERSIAPLVLVAAQALARRVVPLTRNSLKTLVTLTPCAFRLAALPELWWSGPPTEPW
jgi:hypothetical protein